VSNPNETDEMEARFAAVGRDAIQAMRAQFGLTAVPVSNVQVFATCSEPVLSHLLVRMSIQGRND